MDATRTHYRLRHLAPEEKPAQDGELRSVQLLASRQAGRKCFVKDLLGAIGATATATRHSQTPMKFAQRTRAVAYRVADLPFSDAVAEANVHGGRALKV